MGGVPGVSAPAHHLLEHPSHVLSCLVGQGPRGSVECLRIFLKIFCCIPLASTCLSISMPFCKYLTPQMIFLPDLVFVSSLLNVYIICLRLYIIYRTKIREETLSRISGVCPSSNTC